MIPTWKGVVVLGTTFSLGVLVFGVFNVPDLQRLLVTHC